MIDIKQESPSDAMRNMAIGQGYVPKTCLLNGFAVMALVTQGKDPCKGCNIDRSKCHGRSRE